MPAMSAHSGQPKYRRTGPAGNVQLEQHGRRHDGDTIENMGKELLE